MYAIQHGMVHILLKKKKLSRFVVVVVSFLFIHILYETQEL